MNLQANRIKGIVQELGGKAGMIQDSRRMGAQRARTGAPGCVSKPETAVTESD